MNDPIADMLTRIRNAQAVSREDVFIPFSNIKLEIAKILEKHGFISNVKKIGRAPKKQIKIELKYEEKQPKIIGLKRVSKPGQRIYVGAKRLRLVRGGYGMSVVSTPQGLMTNSQARKKNLGGEIICEIW